MRRTDTSATRSIVEYTSGTFDGGPAFFDSSGNGYLSTLYTGNSVEIYKVTAGPNYVRLGSGTVSVTVVAGSKYELKIDGNDLVFLKDDVEIDRQTDTTFRTGLTPGIFSYAGNLRTDNHSDGATSQNINVGLASETDSSLAVSKIKSKAVGLTTETDSVLAATKRKLRSVGLATETDTAQSVSVMRMGSSGLPVETDTSLSVTAKKSKAVGLTSETDTAFSVSKLRFRVVGQPSETDSSLAVSKRKSKAVGLATETDSAFSVTRGSSLPTSYSTSFPLTENPISQDGMFRVGSVTGFYQNPRSVPGKCYAANTSADYNDCIAHLINHAVPNNHRVTATIFRDPAYTNGDSHEVGLYLRMNIGDQYVTGYEFLFSADGSFQIIRWEGTGYTIDNFFLGISVTGPGPGVLVDGDVISAQVIGSDFEVFKNGVSVATASDSTYATGNPGMGFFVRPTGNDPTKYAISTWAAEGASTQVSVGLASETDSAFSVAHKKLRTVGLNTETDTSQPVGKNKTRTIGLTSETDSAFSARPVRLHVVGLTTETDSAFSVAHKKMKAVGLALEVDGTMSVIGGKQSGGGSGKRLRVGLGLG